MSKFKSIDKKLNAWEVSEADQAIFIADYVQLKSVLQTWKINILDCNSFEDAQNLINRLKNIHENEKYEKEVIPKKIDHLITRRSKNFIQLLLADAQDINALRHLLLGCLHDFENEEEIEDFLEKHYQKSINWNKDYISKQVKNTDGLSLIKSTDQILLIKVNHFEALSNIGVGAWCIFRSSNYFSKYKRSYGELYVLIRYNLQKDDPKYICGANISMSKSIGFDGHNKSLSSSAIESDFLPHLNISHPKATPKKPAQAQRSKKPMTKQEWVEMDAMLDSILDNINKKVEFKTFVYDPAVSSGNEIIDKMADNLNKPAVKFKNFEISKEDCANVRVNDVIDATFDSLMKK
jgi:hypothetical protein